MKKVLYVLVGLFVVLVAAALVVPSFIDWNVYKEEISQQVRAATGRDLVIAGDVDLTVLPTPALTAGDVRLANLPGATAPFLARLQSLEVRIGLLPLLRGNVDVRTVALVEPLIELEVLADGRQNWELGPPVREEARVEGGGEPAERIGDVGRDGRPEGPSSVIRAVRVNRFAIENGTLVYRNAGTGTVERIDRVNAVIAADRLDGPYRATGSVSPRGVPVDFEFEMGRLEAGRAVNVNLVVEAIEGEARARVSGLLTEPSATAKVTGKIGVSGEDLGRLVQALGRAEAPIAELARPFSLDGKLIGSANQLRLDDVSLQFGEIGGKGRGSLDLREGVRADIALLFEFIDLDRLGIARRSGGTGSFASNPSRAALLRPAAAQTGSPAETSGAGGASDAEDRGFSLPTGISGTLDLAVNRIQWRGDTIQETRINASLANGEVTLNQASALLPGGSAVSAFGFVTPVEGGPQFDGSVDARIDDPRRFLEWLRVGTPAGSQDRLRSLSFQGEVRARPGTLELGTIDLRVDASRLTGSLSVAAKDRTKLLARLALDRIDLDPYLVAQEPRPRGAPASERRRDGSAAFAAEVGEPRSAPAGNGSTDPSASGGSGRGGMAGLLASVDAEVRLRVGELIFRGISARGLDVDGGLEKGAVLLRNASVEDVEGASARVSGSVSGLPDAPVVDARFDLRAQDLSRLLRAAKVESPLPARALAGFALKGSAKGDKDRIAFASEAALAGGRITGDGEIALLADRPNFSFALGANHADLSALLRTLGDGYRTARADLGPVDLTGRVEGDAERFSVSRMQGRVGPVEVRGEMKADVTGARPKIAADLSLGEVVADMFLPAGGTARSSSTAKEGGIILAAAAGAPPPATERWSREPFNLAALRRFDADLALKAAALAYRAIRVDRPEVVVRVADGVVEVDRGSGDVFGGTLELGARLAALDVPRMRVDLKARDADIRKALFDAVNFDLAEGKMDVELGVDGAGQSPFELVSSLSGKLSFAARSGSFRGFDLVAVSNRLKRLDEPVDILALIQTALSGGTTRFTGLSGNFAIDRGIARTEDLRLIAEAGEARARGSLDLPAWRIDMTTDFRLTEHPKAPPIGMRITGALDQPRRIFDLNGLQAYLVQRGVKKLIEKVLPGEKREGGVPEAGTPGAGGGGGAPAEGEEKKRLPKPEDLLRGILKGL